MRTVAIVLLVSTLAACTKVPERTVAASAGAAQKGGGSAARLSREARGAFLTEPRDIATVEISAQKYKEAVAVRADQYVVLWEAARTSLWLGTFGPEDRRKSHVEDGLAYANTAIKLRPKGEEGLFFHGALAGRLAELDFQYGMDAVKIIETRMRQLLDRGSSYLYGGPDRVLAIVYMRSPGAPLGVGDDDKALTHMKRAMGIESHWPENQLYMAELELRLGKKANDPELTKSALSRLQRYFLGPAAKPPMAAGAGYEFRRWQEDARKLVADYS